MTITRNFKLTNQLKIHLPEKIKTEIIASNPANWIYFKWCQDLDAAEQTRCLVTKKCNEETSSQAHCHSFTWWSCTRTRNRDLKHQDGRWRRVRHIRVKAEARPASRFTRLSMLSNIATATSRQFLEKIPNRKYLENKSSFAITRGELLVAYD